MKKFFYLLFLSVTVLFYACNDDGVETLHKDSGDGTAIDPNTPNDAYNMQVGNTDGSNLRVNVGEYKLVWSDEFNGSSLDESKWTKNYPFAANGGHTHNHNAWMAEENVWVENGNLVIRAKDQRHPDAPYSVEQGGQTRVLDYQAGAVHSKGKFGFTYGYMEARVKSTRARGTWPAFWALNSDGGWPPEIDVLEIPVKSDDAHKVHHYYYHYGENWKAEKSFGSNKNEGIDLSAGFHTYACDWGPNGMKFYFDGKEVGSWGNRNECKQGFNMYLLLNLAVGGWGGQVTSPTSFPDDYMIDYVRVYQKQYFLIRNKKTKQCLKVLNNSSDENAQVVMYTEDANSEAQQWCFPYISGKRLIQNRISGRVLRPEEGQNVNNSNIVLTKNENWGTQQWELVDLGDGYFNIKNVYNDKYLKPFNANNVNNTNLVQYDYQSWENMKWELVPVN